MTENETAQFNVPGSQIEYCPLCGTKIMGPTWLLPGEPIPGETITTTDGYVWRYSNNRWKAYLRRNFGTQESTTPDVDNADERELQRQVWSNAGRGRKRTKSDGATHEAIRKLVAIRANAPPKRDEEEGNDTGDTANGSVQTGSVLQQG